MHVDPGQVCGPVAEHLVEVGGARRCWVRPGRVVPAVAPNRLAGVRRGVVGDQLQAVLSRAGGPQIQSDQRQAGSRQMDVAVNEAGRDEVAVEIDDVSAREFGPAHGVAAQPGDDSVADRHGGRVGMGRAVHPTVGQQSRHATGGSGSRGSAGGSRSATFTTSPSTYWARRAERPVA